MRRSDAYKLANLPVFTKLLASSAMALGLTLFFSLWIVDVIALRWDVTAMDVSNVGESLAQLSVKHPLTFYALLGIHCFSLALILGITRALFGRTPLPAITRSALFGAASALALFDLASWLLVPHASIARAELGNVLVLQTLCFVALTAYPLRCMWVKQRWAGSAGKKTKVVIVGGGFAGLYAAMGLDRALGHHADLSITVIDRNNYFLFPPLLPSVAAGAIETRQVTYPFRRIFEATNIVFKKELVESIDTENQLVRSRVDVDADPMTGELEVRYADTHYDYLVLAPGSAVNTFRTEGTEHAFFMREVSDAIAVRNHVIDCFEHAARETDPALVEEMLRFVIVGGGPTGIELASEIRELIDHVLLKRYPELGERQIDVVVIQSGDRILPGWNDALAGVATEQLSRIRVCLKLEQRVSRIGPDWVELGDGTRLPTRTCVWCAGVKPAALLARTDLPLHASGRVTVGPDCRVPGKPNVFVLGDAAYCEGADKKPLPPLGQVAFQQGTHTAKNLIRLLRAQQTLPFRYFNFGQLVSVGARFAAVDLLGVRLSGAFAWFVWRTLYLNKLVGFGNKVRVVIDWTLDMVIERSSSQLHAPRAAVEARALALSSEAAPNHARPAT